MNMAKATVKTNIKSNRSQDVRMFLRAIADPKRLEILIFAKKDFKSVTEIYQHLGIAQNLTSHHILQLKKNGLLLEKPEGIFRRYKTNEKQINEMLKNLAGVLALKKR
jgi:DNA-binding transcriptional ArsR family regulator